MRLSGKLSVYVVFALLLSVGIAALAQEDCPAIVQAALAAVDQVCSATARNQACYGNLKLDAVPQAGVSDFQFDAPGDIVDVADIGTLHLTPLDEAARQWGVALMRLQANLPDTLPGQNVTMLLFGDVEIKAEADTQLTKPMQAFYLRTGIGDAPCLEAPDSGILVQTPQGAGIIELRVNEVDIQLGSTAYLQAAPGDALVVSTLDGVALVETEQGFEIAFAGTQVSVPLDDQGLPSGKPSAPVPIPASTAAALPLDVLPKPVTLPVEIAPTEEATQEARDGAQTYTLAVPASSGWMDTRISLKKGQRFTTSASGFIKLCVPDTCGDLVWNYWLGPDGVLDCHDPACPPVEGAAGALLGRVGQGKVFVAGAQGDFTADASGTLRFVVADSINEDNVGAFRVVVQVMGAE